MSITITAIFKSKPEAVEELKAVFENVVTETRKEAACIKYDLHQSIDDETTFLMLEEFADEAGIKTHSQQPHLIEFIKQAAALLREPLVVLKSAKIK